MAVSFNEIPDPKDKLEPGIRELQLRGFSILIPSLQAIQDAISAIVFIVNYARVLLSYTLDFGYNDCLAADPTGTTIRFSKDFPVLYTLVATPIAPDPYFVTVDISPGTASPKSFQAYVWDDTGARVDATVYWLALGIRRS